jgi:phosphoglycolate phosphatase
VSGLPPQGAGTRGNGTRAACSYALVVFDFDGTLADSWPWFAATLNDAAARHGFRQVNAVERERLRGLPTREILRALAVPMWKLPRIAADLRARALRDADAIPLFDGMPALLRALALRGVATAIVSSNGEATVRRVLGPALAGQIGQLDCGASLFGKASRLRRVLRQAGIAPAQAILVGADHLCQSVPQLRRLLLPPRSRPR